jgi:hypothetical protein
MYLHSLLFDICSHAFISIRAPLDCGLPSTSKSAQQWTGIDASNGLDVLDAVLL